MKRSEQERKARSRLGVAVQHAVRDGILKRQPCESCGASGFGRGGLPRTQAHHDDYNKPFNVRWLCESCHKYWHVSNHALQLSSSYFHLSIRGFYILGAKCLGIDLPTAICEVCKQSFRQTNRARMCSSACGAAWFALTLAGKPSYNSV